MEAELTALATTAVAALTGLMVTESWEQAKLRLAGWFRRRGGDENTQSELQAAGEELANARVEGDARAAGRVEERLRERLLGVLQDDPEAAGELAQLITDLAPHASVTYISSVSGGMHHGPSFQGAHLHGDITFTVPAPVSAGTRPRPNQLPARTYRFVNRDEQINELRQAFPAARTGSDHVDLVVVSGVSGVGKTATVLRFAETVQDLYPDGQLYVPFAGLRDGSASTPSVGTGVTDVSEALAMCLSGLGVGEGDMPRTVEARANLLRSCSADLRILLVLDDVTEPAHVRTLIPKGPGSGVLVTSHRTLGELVARDDATPVGLKPLDDHGGLALLADLCPRAVDADQTAAERLVRLCGGLPVALRIVAARLKTEEGLTAAELVEELSDETDRLAGLSLPAEELSVSAALGPSYRLLPPDAARLYRLLGCLPTSRFDAGVAAATADVDTRVAKRLLRILAGASLVQRETDGRYVMHDLIRLHARECADREEPATVEAELIWRVGTHYLVLTAFADRAIKKKRKRIADLSALLRDANDPFAAPDGPAPLVWLNTERAAILGILRTASRYGWHTLVWQLAEAFTALFLHHRYLDSWRESLALGAEAAAAAATEVDQAAGEVTEAWAAEARLRSLLSRPLMDLDRHDEARTQLEQALLLAETVDDLVLRASVMEFQGRYLDRHDPGNAVAAYRRSLALNVEAGEARGAAIAAVFLGSALSVGGEHTEALAVLRRAHDDLLADEEPDVRMAARALAAIGLVRDRLGDTGAADRDLKEAVGILRERNAMHYAAEALVGLAGIAQRTGADTDVVRDYLTEALEIYERDGNPAAGELRRWRQEWDGSDGPEADH
ncbi:AAA family ATPase [Streptomyces sp. NPDC088387]|uniref:AAA family ATPase n=1 Tax=Streptomyces sp. NPDC088387 TaxID=3365859 RepID=UPI0038205BFA